MNKNILSDETEKFKERFHNTFRLCCDDKTLEQAVLDFLTTFAEKIREGVVEMMENEKEILEKVLAKATTPNNIAIYEEKIETVDDLLAQLKNLPSNKGD